MKRSILTGTISLLLALLPILSHAQSVLFQKYSDTKGVSSVYISKAMIENNSHLFTQDLYIGKVSGKLNSVQILSTSVNDVRSEMAKDVRDLLKKEKYELLMKQKSSMSNTEFYMLRKGERVKEFIMFVESATKTKLIFLEGDMEMGDIQRIMQFQQVTGRSSTHIIHDGKALQPGTSEYEQITKKVEKALQGIDMEQLRENLLQMRKELKGV